ncbi:MAG TPA: type II toxin-antitoxin system ParD family antitoxin [Azospirillum sp.]|nr:type II toxin-antitoxin system ParD family antitoxin [Azospirillum sp.]
MTESKRAMPEKITVEMRAEELPESIKARMKERPVPGMPYRVTVEPVDDREAKLEALRRDLMEGIEDLEAGRSRQFDVEEFLAEMHHRHGAGKP